jgi:hypothetical protein
MTSFQVEIYEVEASIFGSGIEVIELWFKDLSVVRDIAGNNFAEGRFKGNLKVTEYIAPGNILFINHI